MILDEATSSIDTRTERCPTWYGRPYVTVPPSMCSASLRLETQMLVTFLTTVAVLSAVRDELLAKRGCTSALHRAPELE